MTEEIKQKEIVQEEVAAVVAEPVLPTAAASEKPKERFGAGAPPRDHDPRKRNFRRGTRDARAKPEFDQKIINIRRVARVAAGGRRFSFSVAMIIGNRRGAVGVGTGKGGDTAGAIDKAARDAKKNLMHIKLTPEMSISHRVEVKYSSARIMLMPSPGRGVVAGGAVRSVLELAGVKDITTKILSPSKNGLNTARATVLALSRLILMAPRKKSVDTKSDKKEEAK